MRKHAFLVCNVGWMDRYKGLGSGDSISGGGAYVKRKGYGDEIYNFAVYEGKVYGGVYPVPSETIRIDKLGAKTDSESVDGVTVIWAARNPGSGGTYGCWLVHQRDCLQWLAGFAEESQATCPQRKSKLRLLHQSGCI